MYVRVNKASRDRVKPPTPFSISRLRRGETVLRFVLVTTFVLLVVKRVPPDPPSIAILGAKRAQEIVDQLRAALSVKQDVGVVVVAYHPLVFSVEPVDRSRNRFKLSMELGFLQILDDDELHGALAHEMGHVWLYTHRPFLQTERLANEIGMRVVGRQAFERLYTKLWSYEGTTGVPLEQLLGANPE
jgi:hypothetical protein